MRWLHGIHIPPPEVADVPPYMSDFSITAHDNGGTFLVIETSDMHGGTSATSGAGI